MEHKIVVDRGEVNKIAKLMGCHRVVVSRAVNYQSDSSLARRIRKMAILRGGVEVGGTN